MIKVTYLNMDRTIRSEQNYKKHKVVSKKFRNNIVNQAFMRPTIIVIKDSAGVIEEIEVNK